LNSQLNICLKYYLILLVKNYQVKFIKVKIESFGDYIRRLRICNGLNQTELAAKVGLDSGAIFLTTLIRKEKYRYSFGRKWGIERMNESLIKLPIDPNGKPDWLLMETYIKSLLYSSLI
jgi:DNA-binding XRE family transcriptional regulator